MPSPFPGMDPYLEDPAIWSGVHHALLTAIQERLSPQLRPKYFVRVEERVYVSDESDPAYRLIVPDVRVIKGGRSPSRRPISAGTTAVAEMIAVGELADPEIHEHRLEIVDRVDRAVVTLIEVLSPTNKLAGAFGRQSFLKKRREVFASTAHWLEIDLLRGGIRTANFAESANGQYQLYLSRAGDPRHGYVLPIAIEQRLPVIGVPLKSPDADVPLDLQAALDHVYEMGGYDMDLDYSRDPIPPLEPGLAQWARNLTTSPQ